MPKVITTVQDFMQPIAQNIRAMQGQMGSGTLQNYALIRAQLGDQAANEFLKRQAYGTPVYGQTVSGGLQIGGAGQPQPYQNIVQGQAQGIHPDAARMGDKHRAVYSVDNRYHMQDPFSGQIYDPDPSQKGPAAMYQNLSESELTRLRGQDNQLSNAIDFVSDIRPHLKDIYSQTGKITRGLQSFADKWGFPVGDMEAMKKAYAAQVQQVLGGEDLAALSRSSANNAIERNVHVLTQEGASPEQAQAAYDKILKDLAMIQGRAKFRGQGKGWLPMNPSAIQREKKYINKYVNDLLNPPAQRTATGQQQVASAEGKTERKKIKSSDPKFQQWLARQANKDMTVAKAHLAQHGWDLVDG
jgi:hypothetical protein